MLYVYVDDEQGVGGHAIVQPVAFVEPRTYRIHVGDGVFNAVRCELSVGMLAGTLTPALAASAGVALGNAVQRQHGVAFGGKPQSCLPWSDTVWHKGAPFLPLLFLNVGRRGTTPRRPFFLVAPSGDLVANGLVETFLWGLGCLGLRFAPGLDVLDGGPALHLEPRATILPKDLDMRGLVPSATTG